MSAPRVAIVVSTLNEERYIDAALDAMLAQTVDAEIVVVDGGSTDRTVERLHSRAAEQRRVRVYADGKRRTLPEALNLGIATVQAPYVAKVDARTFIAPDFLERGLEILEAQQDGIACAGGQPEQFGTTPFAEGLALARRSPFGVGASRYADLRARAEVESVQCGIYRRDALTGVGGFDPDLQFGEDEELNWRLRRRGLRIVRDSSIRLRYVARPTWNAAFRQYRNYGIARARVWRKHPEFLRPHHVAPSLAVLGFSAFALGACFSKRARTCLALCAGAYALLAGSASVAAAKHDLRRTPFVFAAFTALHSGYGTGFVEGLLQHALARSGDRSRRSDAR